MNKIYTNTKTLSLRGANRKKYDYIVFICRCQPPHNAHLEIINRALSMADNVVIILGSSNQPRTIKNPFTAAERMRMIVDCFDIPEQQRLKFAYISDRAYSDQQWVRDIQEIVDQIIHEERPADQHMNVGIIGHVKDDSSYYLEMFPQWRFEDVENIETLHSTDVRRELFSQQPMMVNGITGEMISMLDKLPRGVVTFLEEFKEKPEYQKLVQEYDYIEKYKKGWEAAPYPPTFVTVDAVVVQSGHVLMIRRRAVPGVGLMALPGGFINQDERLEDAMIRELREETKLKVPSRVLTGSIKFRGVYDNPNRSLRGRTITHAYLIELPPGELPKVKGSDDADKAFWIPLNELEHKQDQIFEDHFDVICDLVGKL